MKNLKPGIKYKSNQKEVETIKDGKKVIVKSVLKYTKIMVSKNVQHL